MDGWAPCDEVGRESPWFPGRSLAHIWRASGNHWQGFMRSFMRSQLPVPPKSYLHTWLSVIRSKYTSEKQLSEPTHWSSFKQFLFPIFRNHNTPHTVYAMGCSYLPSFTNYSVLINVTDNEKYQVVTCCSRLESDKISLFCLKKKKRKNQSRLDKYQSATQFYSLGKCYRHL